MKLTPTILIDTREQVPWSFMLPTEPATLDTGDYSVRGLEHLVAIERKSLSDLLGCIGRDRERFTRELQRLRAYRFGWLIVETTLTDLEAGPGPGPWPWQSKLLPAHVLGSLAAWECQFELSIVFGGSHDASGRYAERLLFHAARTVAKEVEAVTAMMPSLAAPERASARRRASA